MSARCFSVPPPDLTLVTTRTLGNYAAFPLVTPHIFPVARFAATASSFAVEEIVARERVTLGTVGFCSPLAAPEIFALGNNFHVGWVNTASDAAEVVNY